MYAKRQRAPAAPYPFVFQATTGIPASLAAQIAVSAAGVGTSRAIPATCAAIPAWISATS
jgi:hypothetical protein